MPPSGSIRSSVPGSGTPSYTTPPHRLREAVRSRRRSRRRVRRPRAGPARRRAPPTRMSGTPTGRPPPRRVARAWWGPGGEGRVTLRRDWRRRRTRRGSSPARRAGSPGAGPAGPRRAPAGGSRASGLSSGRSERQRGGTPPPRRSPLAVELHELRRSARAARRDDRRDLGMRRARLSIAALHRRRSRRSAGRGAGAPALRGRAGGGRSGGGAAPAPQISATRSNHAGPGSHETATTSPELTETCSRAGTSARLARTVQCSL